MVSKCANPRCSARMKYMHDGSLYVVPKPAMDSYGMRDRGEFSAPSGEQIECFWLCEACSRKLTITKQGEVECRGVGSAVRQIRSEAASNMQNAGYPPSIAPDYYQGGSRF